MLRMKPQKDANRAEAYYPQSDAGYYVEGSGLHCEWGGKARLTLGLAGPPTFEQFRNLVHGLDPHTAEQLTARLLNGRLCGWDVTASNPKGVTLALEAGDERIHAAMWVRWTPLSRPRIGDPSLLFRQALLAPTSR